MPPQIYNIRVLVLSGVFQRAPDPIHLIKYLAFS